MTRSLLAAALLALFAAPAYAAECRRVEADKCRGVCHDDQERELTVLATQFESCMAGCPPGTEGAVCRGGCRDPLKSGAATSGDVLTSCLDSCTVAHGCDGLPAGLSSRGFGDGASLPDPRGSSPECSRKVADACLGGCHDAQERENATVTEEYVVCVTGCPAGDKACRTGCRSTLLGLVGAAAAVFEKCTKGCATPESCVADGTVSRAAVLVALGSYVDASGTGDGAARAALTRAPAAKAAVAAVAGRAQGAGMRR